MLVEVWIDIGQLDLGLEEKDEEEDEEWEELTTQQKQQQQQERERYEDDDDFRKKTNNDNNKLKLTRSGRKNRRGYIESKRVREQGCMG